MGVFSCLGSCDEFRAAKIHGVYFGRYWTRFIQALELPVSFPNRVGENDAENPSVIARVRIISCFYTEGVQ
jgi:hypothetical protein